MALRAIGREVGADSQRDRFGSVVNVDHSWHGLINSRRPNITSVAQSLELIFRPRWVSHWPIELRRIEAKRPASDGGVTLETL